MFHIYYYNYYQKQLFVPYVFYVKGIILNTVHKLKIYGYLSQFCFQNKILLSFIIIYHLNQRKAFDNFLRPVSILKRKLLVVFKHS